MSDKLELRLGEWNSFVSDETQCASLSHDEEIAFLSSKSKNMAEYLKLHPEMAHELMVPSGFKQCLIRRYERYLSGTQMLSTQNGAAKHAQWDKEIFDALLPEEVNVVGNPSGTTTIPTWRELCHFVCTNGTCTVDGEAMAPQYEYKATGEKVRIIKYGMLKVEVTEKQWHLMWSHVVCQFAKPYGDDAAIYSTNHDQIEFIALQKAYTEMASTPQPWNDWQWPIGQQIAIILKQLESRLRGIHKRVPTWRCEYPSHTKKFYDKPFEEFLTKEEAASLVCKSRIIEGRSTVGIDYDPVVRAELTNRGLALPPEGANCKFVGGKDIEMEESEEWEDSEDSESG